MDIMNLQILEDGTITVKTTDISDGNHMSADSLLEQLDTLMGGKRIITENKDELNKMRKRINAVHTTWLKSR